MHLEFQELRGAAGDVKELEFISALHQTDEKGVRVDASIEAQDVRLFLMSRYGIKVTEEEVRNTIFDGMAGGNGAAECLDLMEVVAILLIPTLLKATAALTGKGLPEGVVPPPSGLLEHVLRIIVDDVTGSRSDKPLTKDLLRSILGAYGEFDLASDETLLDEMITAAESSSTATSSTTSSGLLLNVHSFAEGLTSDIQLYNAENEIVLKTNIEAIFSDDLANTRNGPHSSDNNNVPAGEGDAEEGLVNDKVSIGRPLERVNTLSAIDMTAETYRSRALMVLLWATVLLTFFAYWADDLDTGGSCVYDYNSPWSENADAMGCEAGLSVFQWVFTFGFMALSGLVSVVLGSIGNSVDCKRPWMPLVGAAFIFVFVYPTHTTSVERNRSGNTWLRNVSLILGCATASFHLYHAALMLLIPREKMLSDSIRKWIPQNMVDTEARMRRAAAQKLKRMTNNALDTMRAEGKDLVTNSHYGRGLQEFAKRGSRFLSVGGFRWAWRRMVGRRSFTEDGIWIPARFVSGNIAQYVVTIYVLLQGISLTRTVLENYDSDQSKEALETFVARVFDTSISNESVTNLASSISMTIGQYLSNQSSWSEFGCNEFNLTSEEVLDVYCPKVDGSLLCEEGESSVNYLCALVEGGSLTNDQQMAFLEASGLNNELVLSVAREALEQAAENSVNSLYPAEKYMVAIPLSIATLMAFVTAMYLSVTYIPSVASTILKLRCGVIPTLQDSDFGRYRRAPDQVAILTGSIFFGTLVSSVIVGAFLGLICFFFLWQGSSYFAQRFFAIVIGVLGMFLIRMIIVTACRCALFRAFYREKPRAGNLSILGLEWANFLLSAGFIFVRMLKLLVVAGASIGRLDIPFLAPGVGRIGPVELDNYPVVHTKDILSHEAHRHPYIEQLGQMYLMKLRYALHFGNRAGSCWRLIFVYGLMPWLHKYRLQTRGAYEKSESFSESLLSMTVDNQFDHQSLRFKSLRQLNSSAFSSERMDNRKDHDGTAIHGNRDSSPPGQQGITMEALPHEDGIQLRLKELEAENARLRKALLAKGSPSE